jgi:3'(2'), 5'-bisphosphate nucleotidase
MVKYFACAAGRACGFVQYEEELKSWDHACGLICVAESGGQATDSAGDPVLFADRVFRVKGGIVCASRWASEEVKEKLLKAADQCAV